MPHVMRGRYRTDVISLHWNICQEMVHVARTFLLHALRCLLLTRHNVISRKG